MTPPLDPAAAFRAALSQLIARVLYPYQRRWLSLLGSGRSVAILASRQRGKDWLIALWIALRLIATAEEWHVVSATQGHAKKMLIDVARHLAAFTALAARCGYHLPAVEVGSEVARSSTGATCYSHAATGRAIVGMRENIVLNELSALRSEDAQALFEAAEPIVTNARHNGRRGQMIVLTNATRAGHWLQSAWEGDTFTGWERDLLPWPAAAAELGWSPERIAAEEADIRRRIGPAGWRRWYLCEFSAGGDGYLSDVIPGASYAALPPGAEAWPQVLAYDIGRTSDPSVILPLLISPTGDRYALQAVYLRGMRYADQRARLVAMASARKTLHVAIDANLNEDHWRECARLLPCPTYPYRAGQASHWAIFQDLRADLESGRLRIDVSDALLAADLHGVEAVVSDRDRPSILLPRSKVQEDGEQVTRHCDGAMALALANEVARQAVSRGPAKPQPRTASAMHLPQQW